MREGEVEGDTTTAANLSQWQSYNRLRLHLHQRHRLCLCPLPPPSFIRSFIHSCVVAAAARNVQKSPDWFAFLAWLRIYFKLLFPGNTKKQKQNKQQATGGCCCCPLYVNESRAHLITQSRRERGGEGGRRQRQLQREERE